MQFNYRKRVHALSQYSLVLLLFSPTEVLGNQNQKRLHVRVMTYNIRFDFKSDGPNRWKMRAAAVAEQIKKSEAQIVCLQEDKKEQIEDLRQQLPQFTFLGRGRNATGFGERTSILFETDRFNLKEQGDFWLSDTPNQPGSNTWDDKYPRKVTWVVLQSKTSRQSLLVLNVHLPEGKRELLRTRGVKLIHSWILEKLRRGMIGGQNNDRIRAVVLAGDFNAAADSDSHNLLTEDKALPLLDVWEVVQPADAHPGTYGGWSGMTTKKRIDWLLVAGKVKVLGCDKLEAPVQGRYPSDHYPVIADLQISS